MINTVAELEEVFARPSPALVRDMARLEGDLMILGAAGKMGPSLAQLAKHAIVQAGVRKEVIAVSRFSSPDLQAKLDAAGIRTIAADLLDEEQLAKLPDVTNIIYMVGMKFGTTGQEHLTWAMNAYLPGRVAERFKRSRMVVFSTGNVYPLTPVSLGGAAEDHPTGPVGEYAQSCLGRERVFEHASYKYGIPMLHFRLNYAIDLRYGVLLEIARAIWEGRPVQLDMGHVNVIWQGDANDMALRSLHYCQVPPKILNATGPETVSVRWLAQQFGDLLGKIPALEGTESDTALLSNASSAHALLGYPQVTLRQMIQWTAHWVRSGRETLGKPTHFQEREGRF